MQTPTETSVGPTLQNQPEAATLQNEGGCSSEISAAIPATAPMTQPTASMPAKGILAFGAGGEPARGILASGAGGEPGRTGSAAAAVIHLTANATGASQRETTIPAGRQGDQLLVICHDTSFTFLGAYSPALSHCIPLLSSLASV